MAKIPNMFWFWFWRSEQNVAVPTYLKRRQKPNSYLVSIFGAKIQIHKLKINVPHNKGNVVKKWDLSCGFSNSVTTNDVYGLNNSFLPFPNFKS